MSLGKFIKEQKAVVGGRDFAETGTRQTLCGLSWTRVRRCPIIKRQYAKSDFNSLFHGLLDPATHLKAASYEIDKVVPTMITTGL